MKRTLTGIVAASMVLGTMVPAALAATTASTVGGRKAISVNGAVVSNPFTRVANDAGTPTSYMGVWYLGQAVTAAGGSYTWNPSTKTFNIVAPGVTASSLTIPGGVGTGNTTIQVNGTTVKMVNSYAWQDPAGGKSDITTFMPVFYLQEIFGQLGGSSWNGSTFNFKTFVATPTPPTATTPALSNMTVANATSGTGSSSSPAVSLTGSKMTFSTTLTDSMGNPVANTQVTFNFTEYGQLPSNMPTVYNANGNVVSETTSGANAQYQVYTNAQGVASISVQGPSGVTYAYQVNATAPYQNANGTTLSTGNIYAEFVANNQAGISPLAPSTAAYNATIGTSVPVTVALPPNSAGLAQSGTLVTFTATGGSAYFTNASGGYLGKVVSVPANSSGVAQIFLTDGSPDAGVSVAATLPTGSTTVAPPTTYFNFIQAGVATQVGNLSVSNTNPNAGQNVVVSGTIEDAAGNPMPNSTVLLVGSSSSGDFGYLTGTTTTDFPSVNIGNGVPATSNYGDVLTTDAAGNFSVTMTDTKAEQGTWTLYPVTSGLVSGGALTNGSGNITFAAGSSLTQLAVAGLEAGLSNNATSVTGLVASDTGTANVWIEPQNSLGNGITGQSFTYNVSVNNGGDISSINGTTLTNAVSALTVTETYTAASGSTPASYAITVPGQTAPIAVNATQEDLNFGITNSSTGATTVTVSSGSYTATAKINFTASGQTQATNFAPAQVTLGQGASQTFTYQVQDAQGNPVANAPTILAYNPADLTGAWITAVNGTTLAEGIGTNGVSEPTPIPLYSSGYTLDYGTGSQSVYVPGVVSWTTPGQVTVYSDASGNVSVTIQNGNVSYWGGTGSVTSSGTGATSGTTTIFTYGHNTDTTKGAVYFGNTSSGATGYYGTGSTPSAIGSIGW